MMRAQAAIPFEDLTACAADLRTTETNFAAGASSLAAGQLKAAVTYWAAGLDGLAQARRSEGEEGAGGARRRVISHGG